MFCSVDTYRELYQPYHKAVCDRIHELTNWKTNVLGFREEIRSAEQAQLDALHRVLKLLGGELDEQDDQFAAQVDSPSGSFK